MVFPKVKYIKKYWLPENLIFEKSELFSSLT